MCFKIFRVIFGCVDYLIFIFLNCSNAINYAKSKSKVHFRVKIY